MAGLKDIKRRIKSVKNTKKITYAMKLVSAAKLKKAQMAVTSSRLYTDSLLALVHELAEEQGGEDFSHPLMQPHTEVKRIRLLVLGGSRGLCGGYNSNVNKKIAATYLELQEQYPQAEIDSVVLGKKPMEFYKRNGYPVVKSYLELSESALEWPIDEVCSELESAYLSDEIDQVYLIYTKFKSAMSQTLMADRILPMESDFEAQLSQEENAEVPALGVTLFEPSPAAVFQAIVPRILRTQVRQAGLDAKASEFGCRMVAMDAATTNAGDLIRKLTLTHNKLRQSAITGELLDIVGGAEALK